MFNKKFFIFVFLTWNMSCGVPYISNISSPPIVVPSVTPVTPVTPVELKPPAQIQTRNQVYPFNLIVDTIAFMSCPAKQPPRNPTFFTFKFMALKKGVHLAKDFLKKIKPYTPQNINAQIRNSPYLNTKAQISLSSIADPPNIVNFSGTANGLGFFLPIFSNPIFINTITTQYKSLTIVPNRPLQTVFPASGDQLPNITPLFGLSHVFTLSYSLANNHSPLFQKPGVYYGKTYNTILGGGEHQKSYLNKIQENDLATGQKSKSWKCSKSLRFPIFRHHSVTQYLHKQNINYFNQENLSREAICIESKTIPTQRNQKFLESILARNTFSFGEVHLYENNGSIVSTKKPCIVPKDARYSCYANTSAVRIEFDPDETCTFLDRNNRCPSYLSVCTRS